MYKGCSDCFHFDPKICESLALCIPLEMIADYESCRCRKCHDEQSQFPEPSFDPIESD